MVRLSDTIMKTDIYYCVIKQAGIKETLDQLGVSEDVANWVLQQPQPMLAVVMPALKANPNASIDELSSLQPLTKSTGNVPYTEEEYLKAQNLDPQVGKWYLIQCRKSRNTPTYQDLQNNIDRINKYINLFGNNLGNYSVTEALKHLEQVGPVWDQIKYADPDFRAWVTRQLIESPNAHKLRENLISVRDWYAATAGGTLLPNGDYAPGTDIKTHNIDQAVEKALEWHRELPKEDENIVVYTPTKAENIIYAPKEWDGWNIQRVVEPQDLKAEGNLMHHCVGSYVEEVKEGISLIYSLRDPYNVPKVTIELTPSLSVVQTQAYGDSVPPEKYQKLVDEWTGWLDNSLYGDDAVSLLPEVESARDKVIPDSAAISNLAIAANAPEDEAVNIVEKTLDHCNPALVRKWVLETTNTIKEDSLKYGKLVRQPRAEREPDLFYQHLLLNGLNAKRKMLAQITGNYNILNKLDSSTAKEAYLAGASKALEKIEGKDTLVLVQSYIASARNHAAYYEESAPELISDTDPTVAHTAATTITKNLPKDQLITQYTSSSNGFMVLAAYQKIIGGLEEKIDQINRDEKKDEETKQKEKLAIDNEIKEFIYNEHNTNYIESVFSNPEEQDQTDISKALVFAKRKTDRIFAKHCDINTLSEEELFYYAKNFDYLIAPKLDKDKLLQLWDAGVRSINFLHYFLFGVDIDTRAKQFAPYVTEDNILEVFNAPGEDSHSWSYLLSQLLQTDIGKKVALENNLIPKLEVSSQYSLGWLKDYPIEILPLLKTTQGVAELCKDKKLTLKQLQYLNKHFNTEKTEKIIAAQIPENLLHTVSIKFPEARKILYGRLTDPKTIKRLMHQDIKNPELIEHGNKRLHQLNIEINKQKKKKRKSAGIDEIGKFASIYLRFANPERKYYQ